MPEHKIILALGSNLGNRLETIKRAAAKLRIYGIKTEKMSSVWETEPWGLTDQPLFLNMCLSATTTLEPKKLLTLLKETERELGRSPGLHWGPRVIDIDIIYYDDLILEEPELTIPHQEMQNRSFVLRPLAEIAPELRHPKLGLTAAQLLSGCEGADKMLKICIL